MIGPCYLFNFLIFQCHANPIYYKTKNESIQILRKDGEINLYNLDTFSLLPNEFEWTIKIEKDTHDQNSPTINTELRVLGINEINKNLGDVIPDLNSSRTPSPENLVSSNQSEAAVSSTSRKRSLNSSNKETDDSKKIKTSDLNEPQPSSSKENELVSTSTVNILPQSVLANDSIPNIRIKPDPDSTESFSENSNKTETDNKTKNSNELSNQPSCSTTSNIVVKTEQGVNVKVENSDIEPSQATEQEQAGQAPSNRPSCEFGIRCFRHGDDHRREYAHPSEVDYRRPNFPKASSDCKFSK